VHEHGPGDGGAHHLGIDLIRAQDALAFGALGLRVAHRYPDVGVAIPYFIAASAQLAYLVSRRRRVVGA